jgi:hypothetical protein
MSQASIADHADGPKSTDRGPLHAWSMQPAAAQWCGLLARRIGAARMPVPTWPGHVTDIGGFLLRPRPLSLLLFGSFICAVAFCLSVFDLGFLAGTSAYWHAPRGLVGGSWADISAALSGYYYFVRDAWTLPLFQASKLGTPAGTNIIFTDSIPVVAIFGRLLYRATGLVVNPYGAWTALCFVCSALSMTGLVATLGQRGIAAATMATVCALSMPALLARWGHMSLMAQWEIPLAFIIYFRAREAHRAAGIIVPALLLATLTLWTHSYLFVMVVGILACALVQASLDRRLRVSRAAAIGGLSAAVFAGLVFISGHLAGQGSLSAQGFGLYSMNLLSPVIPQHSALVPLLGDRMVDATGGQYEGFSYLGAGVLLLVILTLPLLREAIITEWPGHACIIVLLLACTMFAISNQVWFGFWHIVTVPLPASLLAIASMFRSSGRFFWPCLYLLTATAIVAAPMRWGRAGACLLIVAATLQFVDVSPLRSALAARIAAPAATPITYVRWENAIRQHTFLRVVPTLGCLTDRSGPDAAPAAVELQLLASRENIATNTVYAARHAEDCASQDPGPLAPGELRVHLLSVPNAIPPSDPAQCALSATLAVCSRTLAAPELASLVATQP